MANDPANDNRRNNGGGYGHVADSVEDLTYASAYLKKAMAHFRDCKISHSAVSIALTDALFAYTPGSPYDKLPYEGDILAGLTTLIPAEFHVQNRVKVYRKALVRIAKSREDKSSS